MIYKINLSEVVLDSLVSEGVNLKLLGHFNRIERFTITKRRKTRGRVRVRKI